MITAYPSIPDFESALSILYPYKEQLELIKKAEFEGQFDSLEITDPWSALTYYRKSNAYETYHIKKLSEDLYEAMKKLTVYHYSSELYEKIQNDVMSVDTNPFENWHLYEVYIYLQMLFEPFFNQDIEIDTIVIENAIISGQLLDIMYCFLYRI